MSLFNDDSDSEPLGKSRVKWTSSKRFMPYSRVARGRVLCLKRKRLEFEDWAEDSGDLLKSLLDSDWEEKWPRDEDHVIRSPISEMKAIPMRLELEVEMEKVEDPIAEQSQVSSLTIKPNDHSRAILFVNGLNPQMKRCDIKKLLIGHGCVDVHINYSGTSAKLFFEDPDHANNYIDTVGSHLRAKDIICSPVYHPSVAKQLFAGNPINHEEVLRKVKAATSFEQQVNVLIEDVLLSEDETRQRHQLAALLTRILVYSDFEVNLQLLGSSVNGVGFKEADMDLFVEMKALNNVKARLDQDVAILYLQEMHKKLRLELNIFICQPILAKCPIMKVDFCEKGVAEGLKLDICVTNALGTFNSRLINLFSTTEPLFRDLALILKYWAKKRNFIGLQKFTSYAFLMLVTFYCQSAGVLPSVESLRQGLDSVIIEDRWDVSFSEQSTSTAWTARALEGLTLPRLLLGFFNFYSRFPFKSQVLRPFDGVPVDKDDESLVSFGFNTTPGICIQDVFEQSRNLTERIGYNSFIDFVENIRFIERQIQSTLREVNEDEVKCSRRLMSLLINAEPVSGVYSTEEDVDRYDLSPAPIVPQLKAQLFGHYMQTWSTRVVNIALNVLTDVLQFPAKLLRVFPVALGRRGVVAEIEVKIRDKHHFVWEERVHFTRKQLKEDLDLYQSTADFVESEILITKYLLEDAPNVILPAIFVTFRVIINALPFLPLVDIDFNIENKGSARRHFQAFLKDYLFRHINHSYNFVSILARDFQLNA